MSCVSADVALLTAAPTPLTRLDDPMLRAAGVELWLKREELRDPVLGGNKWWKLQGHLRAASLAGHARLLSFGGAWSNHLHALAAAGARFGFATVGLVRGNQGSAMLDDCRQWGMQLVALGYADYRRRHDAAWQAALLAEHGPGYLIPEGGGGEAGREGFQALAAELMQQVDGKAIIAVAMGTGTTLAGLAAHLPEGQELWGFPVLPLGDSGQKLADELQSGNIGAGNTGAGRIGAGCRIWQGCVDSAYGRMTPALRAFMEAFERQQGIPLDPVYTGKLLQALYALAQQGQIPRGTRIVALHSGGLQGRRGFGFSFPALPVAVADSAVMAQVA
jgi:1-aminocyclopropane-1-carboxylate deaminase